MHGHQLMPILDSTWEVDMDPNISDMPNLGNLLIWPMPLIVTLSKAARGQSAIEITIRPAWKTTHLMATNNGYLTVTHEFFIVVHKWARNELFTTCLHEKRVLNFQPIKMSHVCLVAIISFINLPNEWDKKIAKFWNSFPVKTCDEQLTELWFIQTMPFAKI